MEEEVAAAGMEALDEETEISVMPEAYEASDLVGVPLGGVINPLGNENWDWFVFNVLAAGGMKVEMLHEATDVARHQSVQIVQERTRSEALTKTNKDNIAMVDEHKMFGLQVKLPGEHHWRITVVNENKDQHIPGSRSGPSRGGLAGKATTVIENTHLYEIAVPLPDDGDMQCTIVVARAITINIAFKTHKADGVSTEPMWNDTNDMPFIAQRRIDVVFTNKYLTFVQVRVLHATERRA